MPIHDKVCKYAHEMPDKIAITLDHRSMTYRTLWANTGHLYLLIKNTLKNKGSKTIALILGNKLEFASYYLASTMSPHVCAVIDPNYPETQIRDLLTQLQPDLIVIAGDNSTVNNVVCHSGFDYIKANDVQVSDSAPIHSADSISVVPDAPFLISFTSGTTSFPKAYIRSHQSWRKSLESGYDIFHLNQAERTLCPCPLSYGIALYCLNEVLYSGGTFFGLTQWNNEKCLEVITTNNIDRIVMVPAMIISLNDDGLQHARPCFNVNHVVSAGAKLDVKKYRMIRARFPNANIQEYYGASELGFVSVSELNDNNVESKIHSVGFPFKDVKINIVDDDGLARKTGETGHIYVESPLIIERYLWGDDGRAFKKNDGWATVGDMGYLDHNGYLHIVGRSGGMVLTGGFNVYLSEIENTIKGFPHIIEASVIAIPDNYLGNKLVAFIQSDIDDSACLIDLCKKSLPKYKIPREFYKIDIWPLTATGKIKPSELRAMLCDKESKLDKLSTHI